MSVPAWGTIARIEPSHFDPGTAYVVVDYHIMDNRDPFIYKTTDYGQTWKKISDGLPQKHPLAYALEVNALIEHGQLGVRFTFDPCALPEAQRTLELQAEWLNKYPNVSITIAGHCDERGTREYNLALGERRANAVKSYLVALGVDSSRLSTISYGKERPAVLGSNDSSWAQNRRSVTEVN